MKYDVLIVGCGPSGATLANILAQAGHSVAIFDRDKEVFYAPRAMSLDAESQRIFQSIDLIRKLVPDDMHPHTEHKFVDNKRRTLAAFAIANEGSADYAVHGHPASSMFYQPNLEKFLRENFHAGHSGNEYGVDAFFGYEVITADSSGEGCWLEARNEDTGEVQRYEGQYLVGADGGASTIRKRVSDGRENLGFSEKYFVMDAYVDDEAFYAQIPEASEFMVDKHRPAVFSKGLRGHVRFDYLAGEGESFEEFEQHAQAQIAKYYDPSQFRIARLAPYTFYAGMATRWRNGRLFLMGDAAHQTPPFAGQGLNMGIRDAANLGFKLSMVLKHQAPDSLLDSYEAERQAECRTTIKLAVRNGQLMHDHSLKARIIRGIFFFFCRHSKRFQAGGGSPGRKQDNINTGGFFGSFHASAGNVMIQPGVRSTGGETVKFDDLLGHGFALVCSKRPQDSLIDWFQQALGGKVLVLGEDFNDPTGQLNNWLEKYRLDNIVVRPDRYIYDAGDDDALVLNELKNALGSQR